MRIDIRKTVLAFAVALAAATPLHAQVYVTSAPRGWLGITYNDISIVRGGQRSGAVTITQVAKGSPAEKAGVQPGDTLVKLNDFRASGDLLRSMGASVEVGDTVHLVVRRGGRDREMAVVVAKRPPDTFIQAGPGEARVYRFDPDSVRGMMRIFVDSITAGIDTGKMRMFRMDTSGLHRLEADSMFFGTMPGTVFRFNTGDSMRALFPPGVFSDSMMRRFPGAAFNDSIFRLNPAMRDSLFGQMARVERLSEMPPAIWEDGRTPDMVFRSFVRGENAFAGADLADINPDLGEYFGARAGVLVLRVPEGTPAARAGLEPGDIVTKIDGTTVATIAQLRHAVEQAKRGATIKLDVVRHQKSKSLELKRE